MVNEEGEDGVKVWVAVIEWDNQRHEKERDWSNRKGGKILKRGNRQVNKDTGSRDKSSCTKMFQEIKAEQARYSTSAPWANWHRSPYTHLPFSLKLRQYSVLNLGAKFV